MLYFSFIIYNMLSYIYYYFISCFKRKKTEDDPEDFEIHYLYSEPDAHL